MPAAARNCEDISSISMEAFEKFSHLVSRQHSELRDGLLEEVDDLLLWMVGGKASRLKSRIASSVFVPLVLPELLIFAALVEPVLEASL